MSISIKQLQRGDTIVEVLIAIAVISLVLAAAYVTSNSNLQAEQESQERSDVLELVESQAEQLKNYMATNTLSVAKPFCMDLTVASGSDIPVAGGNAACVQNFEGVPTVAAPGIPPTVTLSINTDTNLTDNNNDRADTYIVTGTWASTSSTNLNRVQIKYRIQP